MFLYSKKLIFIFLFLSFESVISAFIKRANTDDEGSLKDPEAVEKVLSTMQSILKEADEELEKEIEKEEESMKKEEEKIKSEEETIKKEEESIKKEEESIKKEEESIKKEEETIEKEDEIANKEDSEKETPNEIASPEPSEEKEPENNSPEEDKGKEEETEKEDNQDIIDKESVEKPGTSENVSTEEPINAPKGTFAVWNDKNKICILAKFQVVFSIKYSSKGGEQKAEVHVPEHGTAKGNCVPSSGSRLLEISWSKYVFTMIFNKEKSTVEILFHNLKPRQK